MSTDTNAETWTAAELLTEVYRECRMPSTGTVDYPAAVVLREATDAIRNFAQHELAVDAQDHIEADLLPREFFAALHPARHKKVRDHGLGARFERDLGRLAET